MRQMRNVRIVIKVICVWGILMAPLYGQSSSDGGRPSITVEFENELVTLAKGYEEAFTKLPAGPKFAIIKTPEGPVYLDDSIRELEAAGGVVILRMQRGVVHALNAGDLVRITNENPNSKR